MYIKKVLILTVLVSDLGTQRAAIWTNFYFWLSYYYTLGTWMVLVCEFEGNLIRHVESKVVEVQIEAHFLAEKKENY